MDIIISIIISLCIFKKNVLAQLCVQVCFRAEELLKIYQMNSSGLDRYQFTRLSPALIQQLLSKACAETKPETIVTDSLSTLERKSVLLRSL